MDAGADSLILLALRARITPGDVVVTSAGTYPTFLYFAEGVGARIIQVPYHDDSGHLSVDLDALAAAARANDASLLYIANPDNPTGQVHGRGEMARLRSSLPETTMLIIDEAVRLATRLTTHSTTPCVCPASWMTTA